MALALLELDGLENGVASFRVELGENAWFMYVIGDDEVERVHGLPLIANPSFESELTGPLPPFRRGRTDFTVPVDFFDREHRCIQLMSFRTESQTGPALSDIVRVPYTPPKPHSGSNGGTAVAKPPRSKPVARATSAPRRAPAKGTTPFYLVEASSRGVYSSAMFLETLVGMLPTLLNAAGPVLGNIFGGLFGGGAKAGAAPATGPGSAAGITGAVTDFLKSPENAKMITQLIASAIGGAAPATGATGTPAIPGIAPIPTTVTATAPKSTGSSIGVHSNRTTLARAQFVDGGVLTGPMIAGLIGQLAPLLEKILTPETINALLSNAPTPQNLSKIGMEWAHFATDPNAARAERLWKNTPQIGPNAVPALLATMDSLPASPIPAYRGVSSCTLSINDIAPIALNGSPRVVHAAGRDIRLALSLETPRRITGAKLHWEVKHKDSGEIYAHGVEPCDSLESGPIAALEIAAGALANVPRREPCLLGVHLVWKGTSGDAIGTSRVQLCWFAGEYMYDRVEDSGELQPLNDVELHRDFWHRVWEGTLKGKTPRIAFECKYYYALESGPANVPLSTQRKSGAGDAVRLRSGMVLSIAALSGIRRSLGATEALDAEQLAALDCADFRGRVAQAGLSRVTLRTREGERAALWVYPEVKLQRVILQRVSTVGDDGQVSDVDETEVEFPVPALLHLIGARAQS